MSETAGSPVVELRDLAFSWPGQAAPVLHIPLFRLEAGEQVFLSGPSGSGKSTLLGLIGGILQPSGGAARVLGTEISRLSGQARDRFRGDHTGFIFQQFNLVPYLSVLENVLLPCRFSALRRRRALEQGRTLPLAAQRLLERLDLTPDVWLRRADRLSVGQQQRVAAARAFAGRPELIIADEPTSSLDADRQQAFLSLLRRECAETGASLLFVSHDQRLATAFSRAVTMDAINRTEGRAA
ncbi:MAG: ABC transporter ATP-binding protein [Desulfovibrio sp.]|jgi:putative ABC transport system ATP-binding protein|nr:ABC transporter ATP-binding protein [Desulfovibrio sp.]MDR3362500.1 ABC transporter ATP-binding protein [Desulfovibrio sp.]